MEKGRFFKYLGTSQMDIEQRSFTTGKEYELLEEKNSYYSFTDDVGDEHAIDKVHFEEVTEVSTETREQKIARLEKELEEFKKPKVGDYVVLASKRPYHWNGGGGMDEFLGRVVQLTEVNTMHNTINFNGGLHWGFSVSDIERHATPEEVEEFNKSKMEKLNTNPEDLEFRAVMEEGEGIQSIPLKNVNVDEKHDVVSIGLYRTKPNGEQEHIIDITHTEIKKWNKLFMGHKY